MPTITMERLTGNRIDIEVLLLVVLGAIGTAVFFFPMDSTTLAMVYIWSMLPVGLLLLSTLDNILLVSRATLIFAVGAYPLGVKLYDPNMYFSVYEFRTQSLEIATIMYGAVLVGVAGAIAGWRLGERASMRSQAQQQSVPPSIEYLRTMFYLGAAAAVIAGLMIVSTSSGTIFDAAYGTGTEGVPILGSTSAIGGVAFSVMFYCSLYLRQRNYYLIIAAVGLFLLVWCQLLRGLRQDAICAVFSCVIIYMTVVLKDVSVKARYALYLVPVWALMELWGLMRSGLSMYLAGEIDAAAMFSMGLGNAAAMNNVVYSGTLGPITTTFANTIFLLQERSLDFLHGGSYVDYILRTPPQFMYPDRPEDYAAIFEKFGLSAGGGFFELSEAYLNFGFVGLFFVPLVISLMISLFHGKVKAHSGLFSVFMLASVLCVWIRGTWYQTFAFYKSMVSAVILFAILHGLACVIIRWRKSMTPIRSVPSTRRGR